MSAYAKPGQVIAACYEDPPFFSAETDPVVGPAITAGIGPLFGLWSKYLGDQWSIGDWDGLIAAVPHELADWQAHVALAVGTAGPPQNLREYDPEWGKAFITGSFTASCPHHVMLSQVKVPVLFTHHFRMTDDGSGGLIGACADPQAERVVQLVRGAGQRITYRSFPTMAHSMHGQAQCVETSCVDDTFGLAEAVATAARLRPAIAKHTTVYQRLPIGSPFAVTPSPAPR